MMKRRNLFLAAALLSSVLPLRADVMADALFTFPAQTEYLEYDNLASLRTLPNYSSLRQEFAGKNLEEARLVLSQLGIEEAQVQEVVTASSSATFYGLISGDFSGQAVSRSARGKRYAAKLLETQAFCAGRETCIVFVEDAVAAFGSLSQLKTMLQARQGAVTRLSSNNNVIQLLDSTERSAPVRGLLLGQQLQAGLSKLLRDWGSSQITPSRLPAIKGLGYSVAFQGKAHVAATLECASAKDAATLSQMISVVSALQAVASPMLSTSPPLQDLQASSSGRFMHLKANTVMPAVSAGDR